GAKRPVAVAAVGRELQELPRRGAPIELVRGQEVVVPAVPLALPGRPGGGRDGQLQLRHAGAQLPDQGSLADPRRTRYDEDLAHTRISERPRKLSRSLDAARSAKRA